MREPIVSIIIPVYNAQAYIKQCLNSLLEQTYPYYEIICVDDGSTDQSFAILKEYEKKDNRISAIAQKNQFAGVARNKGMEQATGKYLLFLDADDFFRADMLEQAVRKAEEGNTQILVFDSYRFDNKLQKVMHDSWRVLVKELFGTGVKSARELSDVIFGFTTPSPWNKLFLREYIQKNNLEFQPLQRTNDLFFVYSALASADRIGILDEKLVYYRMNNAASLQGSLDDTPVAFAEALSALKTFLMEKDIWNTFRGSFHNMASAVCVNNLTIVKSKKIYRQLYELLKNEIIPDLEIRTDMINGQLKQAIGAGERLTIYGAGAVATALIRYLLIVCNYKTEQIKVAVTAASNNMPSIYNIEIKEIDALCLDKGNDLVVIAVSEESRQREIEHYLHEKDFKNILKIGYGGIIELLKGTEH